MTQLGYINVNHFFGKKKLEKENLSQFSTCQANEILTDFHKKSIEQFLFVN